MAVPHAHNCQCCAGLDAVTPVPVRNAPGLPQIDYRSGRHGDFLESMVSRLSSADYPALAALTSRESSDFTLAITDALASILEVLGFYTERYAQEHFLRTATERRSVLEMARLIGYRPSPGVAAGTHLAFTLQNVPGAPVDPVEIPVGTRVQSVPGQGETAQSFETTAAVPARAEWNAIPVQRTRSWQPVRGDTELWLEGVAAGVQPGDAILIVGTERQTDAGSERWDVRVVAAVETDPPAGRTRLRWAHPLGSVSPPMDPTGLGVEVHVFRQRTALFGHNAPNPNLLGNDDSNIASLIDKTGSTWEWNGFAIDPTAIDLDTDNAKIVAGSWMALVSNQPGLGSADLPGYTELFRVSTVQHRSRTAFGISGKVTRVQPDTTENITSTRFPLRRTLVLAQSERVAVARPPLVHPVYGDELVLDRRSEGLAADQPLAVTGTRQRIVFAPGAGGLSLTFNDGSVVAVAHGDPYFLVAAPDRLVGAVPVALTPEAFFALVGQAGVSLRLPLVDAHGRTATVGVTGNQFRLASPEDADPVVSEIVVVDSPNGVTHDNDRTTLRLTQSLLQVYARATAEVNANVAPATHGETVQAILGNGDGSVANQRFALAQTPLTYVSANTSSGRTSTLELRANDVLWAERPTLYRAAQGARVFETSQNEEGVTTVRFGDGVEGARLPSGESNVRVRYRKGLGVAGNVAAGKLTTLLSRPLGVGGVANPEAATGGEDPESLSRARENAPLTVLTLDRAVSIDDYANFSRAFSGIDKAHALWIPAGPAQGVFLTIAGVDGAVVPGTSDTYGNLREALATYGDPLVPLRIRNYQDARFTCRMAVKVAADFETDPVLRAVEDVVGSHFSFSSRHFGQAVSVDEVAGVAQGVRGVVAVHVTRLRRAGAGGPLVVPRLFASVPVASLDSVPVPAELLTLAENGLEMEVLP